MALGSLLQQCNVTLLYLLQSQLSCVFGIILLLEHLTVFKFQPSRC